MHPVNASKAFIFATLSAILLAPPASIQAGKSQSPSAGAFERQVALERGEFAPNVDWTRFRQIQIHPMQIAYTTDFELGSSHHRSRFRPEDVERIRRYFETALEERISPRYPVTTTTGSDVLRIDSVLVNPVSDRSWYYDIGKTWLGEGAKFNMLIVLRDSETGEYLHHVAVPLHTGHIISPSSRASYWNYMREIFDRTAQQVRLAIENAR